MVFEAGSDVGSARNVGGVQTRYVHGTAAAEGVGSKVAQKAVQVRHRPAGQYGVRLDDDVGLRHGLFVVTGAAH